MTRPYTRPEDRQLERRADPRRRTLLAARLSSGEPAVTIPCGVRNLSDRGAEIELQNPTLLRPPLRLLLVRDGVIHEARVVWSWNGRAGLAFTASYPPHAQAPDAVQRLRTLWSSVRA